MKAKRINIISILNGIINNYKKVFFKEKRWLIGNFREISEIVRKISDSYQIVFPVHFIHLFKNIILVL